MTHQIGHVPLKKRLVFSLSWDSHDEFPANKKEAPSLWHTLKLINWLFKKSFESKKKNRKMRDLDLYCFCFSGDGQLLETVSPENLQEINDSNSIYHTGEHETGEYGPDDEQISLELDKVPSEIETALIYIDVDTVAVIDGASRVRFKIWDMTDHVVMMTHGVLFDQYQQRGYLFAKLSRLQDGWDIQIVDKYIFDDEMADKILQLGHYV